MNAELGSSQDETLAFIVAHADDCALIGELQVFTVCCGLPLSQHTRCVPACAQQHTHTLHEPYMQVDPACHVCAGMSIVLSGLIISLALIMLDVCVERRRRKGQQPLDSTGLLGLCRPCCGPMPMHPDTETAPVSAAPRSGSACTAASMVGTWQLLAPLLVDPAGQALAACMRCVGHGTAHAHHAVPPG